jgi:F420-0:gamma-glutamyl ligase
MAKPALVALSDSQEAEAQVLAQRIRELADEEFVQIARLLVSKPESEIFGDTEFEVRDILLRAGAKALQEHLRQKKTAGAAAV